MIPASHAHVRWLVLLAAACVMAVLAAPIQAQQVDESLPPLADLSIASEYNTQLGHWVQWDVAVTNNTVGAHPGTHVHLVKVRITLSDDVRGATTQIWTIGDLPPGDSATRKFRSLRNNPGVTDDKPAKVPQRLHAEIMESDPVESPRFESNNTTEHWAIEHRRAVHLNVSGATRYTNGDVGVELTSISDRSPQPGGAATFTVAAVNDLEDNSFPVAFVARTYQDHTQFDVQVEISLSPGLSFAANQQAPGDTTFDTSTGNWNLGTLEARRTGHPSLPVAVVLTAESLADLPLEERCLTARVVRAVPGFASHPSKRLNDTVTACLGVGGLLSSGAAGLIEFYPCIGVTSYPCTGADTLELVVEHHGEYVQPESVSFHVPDPQGRAAKGGSLIWSTGPVMDLRDSQTKLTSNWSIKESVTVTAPGGGDAPGRWLLTNTDDTANGNFDLLDAMDSSTVTTGAFFDLTDFGSNDPADYFTDVKIDFWELGTYKALVGITGRLSGTDYTDSATYTFHVGPMADLEVRDAGASPEAGGSQRAYTIMAVNNGPQAAPGVEVTLSDVPQGAQAGPSEGRYVERDCENGLCAGDWIIGNLSLRGARRASGLGGAATLTLVTAAANPDPVTATIESMDDYCVRIKTAGFAREDDLECDGTTVPAGYTEHSAAYYDHVGDNNMVTVTASAGTAPVEGVPGAPRSLRVQRHGGIAILWWAWMDTVNGFPVTHFQVERSGVILVRNILENQYVDLDVDVNQPHPSYRVRAVNEFGGTGPWSLPAGGAVTDPPGAPTGLTATASDVVGRIVLRWFAPSTDSSLRYRIEHSSDGQSWRVLSEGHSPRTYTHDGLPPAAIQYYRVATVKDGLTSRPISAQATTKTEPGTPAGLTATRGYGVGRIDLAWYPPFAYGGLRYRIEHATNAAGPWQVLSSSYNGLTYSHHGLSPGTTHYYRVASVQDGVISAYAYAHETTEAQPVLDEHGRTVGEVVHMVPLWPEYLRFSSLDRTSVTLVWDPPVDDGGTPVTGYEYRVYGPCASGSDAVCDVVPPTRVNGTSRHITGLTRETKIHGTEVENPYEFQVRALNAVGAGEWSQSIQKTVGPASAGGGRVILSPSRLTVPEGGEATYRVKLSRAPTQPLWVIMHWDGDRDLEGELPFQQFKALLPSGYDTSRAAAAGCSDVPGYDWDGMAYAWNVGVPITVMAAEDIDSENGRLTILHSIYTVPAECLGNPDGYALDPVYDDMFGIALEVTERDND